MIFGRRNRAAEAKADQAEVDALDEMDGDGPLDGVDELDEDQGGPDPDADIEEDADGADLDTDDDESDTDDELDEGDEFDSRADGPFDSSEVDLNDGIERLHLGVMTISMFEGMNLQFQGDPESGAVYSVLVMYESSGLQLELFAAPTSGGLADELRVDTLEEAQQAGGNAEVNAGPFGKEVKRVLPLEGPEGEQLFHVSRIWLVDGPRWLLRGTLMGQAALVDGDESPADVFIEFFRNIVVHRDDDPRVPGELLTLTLPELPGVAG